MFKEAASQTSAIYILLEIRNFTGMEDIPLESVPLPNSSMITRLRLVAKFNARETCCKSIMKVL